MKKIFLKIIIPLAVISCTSQREIVKIDDAEKHKLLIENNNDFANVSVIGGRGAYQIGLASKTAEENRKKAVVTQLQNIDGVSISVNDNDNSIKASLQNDILFKFNSAEVSDKAKQTLQTFSAVILENSDSTKLVIIGHTDNVGEKSYNQVLSEARAKAVSNALVEMGMNRQNLTTTGKGFSEPVSSNNTPEGRSKNRRVDIIIRN